MGILFRRLLLRVSGLHCDEVELIRRHFVWIDAGSGKQLASLVCCGRIEGGVMKTHLCVWHLARRTTRAWSHLLHVSIQSLAFRRRCVARSWGS